MSITRGIVGCWSPSLGASGYLLRDVSGLNNHGTLTNMDPGTDWVASEKGLVLDFDGINDWVDLGASVSLRFESTSWTIAFWVNPVLRGIYQALVANDSNISQNVLYEIGIDPENKLYFFNGSAITYGNSVAAKWQHISVVGEIVGTTQTVRLYQDAINTATLTNVSIFGTSRGQKTRIAVDAETGAGQQGFAQTQIGELNMWHRHLSGSEVAELYRRGNGFLGRELTGMNQRRTYAKKLGNRRRRLLCGGMI